MSANQELRDISSMAMEYFDEKIVPTLKVTRETMIFEWKFHAHILILGVRSELQESGCLPPWLSIVAAEIPVLDSLVV